jgi:hypothetical protein
MLWNENPKERLATQSKNQQGLEGLAGGSRAATLSVKRVGIDIRMVRINAFSGFPEFCLYLLYWRAER